MSEMIKRVARALEESRYGYNIQDVDVETATESWMACARAAIEATREPTEEMNEAGALPYRWNNNFVPPRLELPFGYTSAEAWRAMIDSALKEADTSPPPAPEDQAPSATG